MALVVRQGSGSRRRSLEVVVAHQTNGGSWVQRGPALVPTYASQPVNIQEYISPPPSRGPSTFAGSKWNSGAEEQAKSQLEVLSRGYVKSIDHLDKTFWSWGGRTTPLIKAVRKKDYDRLRLLLSAQADPNKQLIFCCGGSGNTALLIAAEKGFHEAVEILLDGKADPNLHRKDGKNALLISSASGNTHIALALLDAGANAKPKDQSGFTPLMLAVDGQHVEITEALLQHGADPNDTWAEDKRHALIMAVRRKNVELVHAVCEHAVNRLQVNHRDAKGYTALMHAVELDSPEKAAGIVKELLEAEAEVDKFKFAQQKAPLLRAVEKKHEAVVRLLIAHNANVDLKDGEGNSALMAACGDLKLSTILVQAGSDPNVHCIADHSTPLMRAAKAGDQHLVMLFLRAGALVNAANNRGQTALVHAGRELHLPIVELLVQAGADVDVTCEEGTQTTLLMHSVQQSSNRLTQTLLRGLSADATLNRQDKFHRTALVYAAQKGQTDLLASLLQAGARTDMQDCEGRTALLHACLRHEESRTPSTLLNIRALVDWKANVNVQDRAGLSALMVLARCGDREALLEVVENAKRSTELAVVVAGRQATARLPHKYGGEDAVVDLRDSKEWTALMWAVQHDKVATAETLAAHGANVNIPDNNLKTPLMWAACKENKVVVQWLLKHGADVDLVDSKGESALMMAARTGNADMVKLLTAQDANANLVDHAGQTALMMAARLGSADIVRALLQGGAVTSVRDAEGCDAADVAIKTHGLDSQVAKLIDPAKVQTQLTERRAREEAVREEERVKREAEREQQRALVARRQQAVAEEAEARQAVAAAQLAALPSTGSQRRLGSQRGGGQGPGGGLARQGSSGVLIFQQHAPSSAHMVEDGSSHEADDPGLAAPGLRAPPGMQGPSVIVLGPAAGNLRAGSFRNAPAHVGASWPRQREAQHGSYRQRNQIHPIDDSDDE